MMAELLQGWEVRAQQWRQTQQRLEKRLEDGEKASEAEILEAHVRSVVHHCLFIIVGFGCSGWGETKTNAPFSRLKPKVKYKEGEGFQRRSVFKNAENIPPKELPPHGPLNVLLLTS